ncbi:uncharacterized protein LOC142175176 [Nicotiana tabacum]|uniref:Uncharacterized protein LOC142175176 n=1 Tax=Nicotiana tabacum TaxID=4097 RepID=A0AC58TKV1_TOBAC
MWSRRQRGTAIGRIVTCYPPEGERYYLRLLLMNVRGPKSYADLYNVNRKCWDSFREAAEKRGLLHCDNNVIDYMSEAVNYQMPYSLRLNEEKDVQFERNIIVSKEDLLLQKKLNSEQRRAYNIILDRVYSDKPGAFFIDGPGGTGKTFLYRALLANIRSKDIDENFTSNISKQTTLATLIQDSKLIVWDEVSMAKKKMIEAFNTLLKDLMNTNILFGGKVVVFGGDFRQTLPVVRSGKKEDFICENLLYSDIWNDLEKLCLSENMRAKEDPAFLFSHGQVYVTLSRAIKILIHPPTPEDKDDHPTYSIVYEEVIQKAFP